MTLLCDTSENLPNYRSKHFKGYSGITDTLGMQDPKLLAHFGSENLALNLSYDAITYILH